MKPTVLLILISLLGAAARAQTPASTPVAQGRTVFAHYMVTNEDYQDDSDPTQEKKIASYQREIRQAQAMGIDGFALNVGGWFREPYYIRYTAQIFEAAYRLHSGFKLMFSADMCCGNQMDDVADMMRRFAGNSRYREVYFQHDGKFVLTTFAGDKFGPATWLKMRRDLLRGTDPSTKAMPEVLAPAGKAPSNAPLKTFFVPAFFWGGETPKRADIEAGLSIWAPAIDGAFYWGIAGVPGGPALDLQQSSLAYAHALHAAGKLYMAPVCAQFWGSNANRYYEYSGAAGMRRLWQAAITGNADWVEIITWNDFIEGSYISPIDDPNAYPNANHIDASHIPSDTLGYFHSHSGMSDLVKYFVSWYKHGVPPPITKDEVFYFYRTQPLKVDATTPPVDHIYGDAADRIYVTANLTAAARLVVHSGSHVTTKQLAAGSHDVEVPLEVGKAPTFELLRGSKQIAVGTGPSPVDAHPKYRDLYYATGVF